MPEAKSLRAAGTSAASSGRIAKDIGDDAQQVTLQNFPLSRLRRRESPIDHRLIGEDASVAAMMLDLAPLFALALSPGANPAMPNPLVLGRSPCASYTFAKLQRAAQLPGAGFKDPKGFGIDEGGLSKILWSQFGLASAQSGSLVERASFERIRNIEGGIVKEGSINALVFVDALPGAAGGFLKNPFESLKNPLDSLPDLPVDLPFLKKKPAAAKAAAPPAAPPAAPGQLDLAALEHAEAAGMLHAYIALEDRAAMEECMATLKERCPTLSCTLVVPESGVRVEPASGWASQLGQDLGGELVNGLVVRDGLTGDSGARTLAPEDDAPAGYPVAGTTLATQDLAELLVQLAIRTERATPAGEPRVLRVSPYKGAFQAGAIRPGYRVKIGGLTGEKAGKLNGEVASVVERAEVGDGWVVLTDPKPSNAFIGELKKLKDDNLEALDPYVDWTSLLGPWGPVRQNDFADPRLLDPPWDDTYGSMVERGETKAFVYEQRKGPPKKPAAPAPEEAEAAPEAEAE